MGIFSRNSRLPDVVDLICESLRQRSWEWTPIKFRTNKGDVGVEHVSGIQVGLESSRGTAAIKMAPDEGDGHIGWLHVPRADYKRLYSAYLDSLAARVAGVRRNFPETAKAIAQAVLSGDLTAACALVDYLNDNPDLLRGPQ